MGQNWYIEYISRLVCYRCKGGCCLWSDSERFDYTWSLRCTFSTFCSCWSSLWWAVSGPEPYYPKLFIICFKLRIDCRTLLEDGRSTWSILFPMRHHEDYDAKKKKLGPQDTEETLNSSRYTLAWGRFGMQHSEQNIDVAFRELQEGCGSKLFGDERYELLVESQKLLQRGEISWTDFKSSRSSILYARYGTDWRFSLRSW